MKISLICPWSDCVSPSLGDHCGGKKEKSSQGLVTSARRGRWVVLDVAMTPEEMDEVSCSLAMVGP